MDRENHTLGCVKVYKEIEKMPEHIELKEGHFSETELNIWHDPLWIENKDLFNYLKKYLENN